MSTYFRNNSKEVTYCGYENLALSQTPPVVNRLEFCVINYPLLATEAIQST